MNPTLVRARALIADRHHWTQGAAARDNLDRPVSPDASTATCWCATGAVLAVEADLAATFIALDRLEAAAARRHGRSPEGVNDHYGHADVLRMFDDAL